jgi:hypothetical protein
MQLLKYLLLLLFLVGCQSNLHLTSQKKENVNCDKKADEITIRFSNEIMKKYGLRAVGMGGSGDQAKLKLLSVTLETDRKIELLEGRKIILDCIQEYLKLINESEEFKSCLQTYPFTEKNLDIGILFIDNITCDFITSPHIAVIDAAQGVISYMTFIDNKLDVVNEETYEKALKSTIK